MRRRIIAGLDELSDDAELSNGAGDGAGGHGAQPTHHTDALAHASIELVINGIMAGTILAVPAIGLTAIFAVLRFTNARVIHDVGTVVTQIGTYLRARRRDLAEGRHHGRR